MKKTGFSKLSLVLLLALMLAMSLALAGCACGSSEPAAEDPGEQAVDDTPSNPATQEPSVPSDPTANMPASWVGTWNSVSEQDLPAGEQSAEVAAPGKYLLTVFDDGSFTIHEGSEVLYNGVIAVDNNPEDNWGVATIDEASVKVRAVATDGVLQIVFNASDQNIQPNPDYKMIVFQV